MSGTLVRVFPFRLGVALVVAATSFVGGACRSSWVAPRSTPTQTQLSGSRGTCPAKEAELPWVWPRTMGPGSLVRFVAPGGELDPERMGRARLRLEQRGYRVTSRGDLYDREGYLAGSDARRLAELREAFSDPEVDAVFPGTGGYGTMRLLHELDYATIREGRKVLIGFSDITALHLAVGRCARLVTFHSPNPMWGLGSLEGMTPFTEQWFFRALEGVRSKRASYLLSVEGPGVPEVRSWGSGRARGRLVGGNLSLISALEGTPYGLDPEGAVLLIEDVREAPYRIDRMLRQLWLSGKLQRLRGAVLGQFTRSFDRDDAPRDPDPRYTVAGVLAQYFENLGIPVLWNFPVGHHEMNATLPLGGEVEVDADRRMLRIFEEESSLR